MGFANLTSKFRDYKDDLELKNTNAYTQLFKQMDYTHTKVINRQNRLNDNDRYLTQNMLLELKDEKKAGLDNTEKRYLIDNRVVAQTESADPNKLFKLQGVDYGPNLSIKPTISKDFQSFQNNMTDTQKLAKYLEENFTCDNYIYAEYGEAVLTDRLLGDRNSPLQKRGTLFWGFETGGASGGNCWGGEAEEYSASPSIKKEFPALKEFLKETFPDITFLQYDDLQEYMNTTEITDREYYGNHTDYEVQYITAKDLYKGLTKLGFDVNDRLEQKMGEPSNKAQSRSRMRITES